MLGEKRYLSATVIGQIIGPSRPARPPLRRLGIRVGADVPDEVVVGIQNGEAFVDLRDHQQVAPLREIARTVQKGLTKCAQVAAIQVVDDDTHVDAVGYVELRHLVVSRSEEDRVRAQESSTSLFAGQRRRY